MQINNTQIIMRDGKEVMKVETPTGVTGYIATSIPASAIESMAEQLRAQLQVGPISRKTWLTLTVSATTF